MNIYFQSGFETGDLSEFTGGDGTVQNSVVKSGTYALRNSNGNYAYKWLPDYYSTIYFSGFFRWSADRPSGEYIVAFQGATGYQGFLKTYTGNRIKYINNGNSTSYYGSTILNNNTWYFIEAKIVTHDSAGSIEIKIGGITEILQTGIDTKNGSDTGIALINLLGVGSGSGYCYIDQIKVSDEWESSYGIKISEPGYGIDTGDTKRLILETTSKLIKVAFSGSVALPSGGGDAEITHNLGYIPQFLVYPNATKTTLATANWDTGVARADTSKIYVRKGGSGATTAQYYIFYEQA